MARLSDPDYDSQPRRPNERRRGRQHTAGVATATRDNAPDELVLDFVRHLKGRSPVSPTTLEAYATDLQVLDRWAGQQGHRLQELDEAALGRFFAERAAAGLSPATIARQMTSCRKFYGFLATTRGGEVPTGRLRNPARDPARVPLLPPAALTAVATATKAPRGDFTADYRRRRDHAMACLLMSTGMLVTAIRTLRWTDIDADWKTIRCHAGTPQEQCYVLRGEAREALLGLKTLATLLDTPSGYCFPGTRGQPLSRQGLCQRIRKFGRDLGLTLVVTPTALRRAAPRIFRTRHPVTALEAR